MTKIALNTGVAGHDDRHCNKTILTRIAEELAAHDAGHGDLIFSMRVGGCGASLADARPPLE